jgi:hypothetical protein
VRSAYPGRGTEHDRAADVDVVGGHRPPAGYIRGDFYWAVAQFRAQDYASTWVNAVDPPAQFFGDRLDRGRIDDELAGPDEAFAGPVWIVQVQIRDSPLPSADPLAEPHRVLSVHEGHTVRTHRHSPSRTRRITQFGEYDGP